MALQEGIEGLAVGGAQRLASKAYPAAMTDWFLAKVTDFEAQIKAAQEAYASEATKVQGQKPELAQVESGSQHVDQVLQKLDGQYKTFREGVCADVKKLFS